MYTFEPPIAGVCKIFFITGTPIIEKNGKADDHLGDNSDGNSQSVKEYHHHTTELVHVPD